MESAKDKLAQTLKNYSLSVTIPRLTVFEILYAYGLQSMNQLVERCSQIDRASVYRTIDSFEKIGAVQRVQQGFKFKIELSDSFLPHHHHITCTKCGTLTDIEQARLENLLEEIAKSNDYLLTSHKVELFGLCNKCRIN